MHLRQHLEGFHTQSFHHPQGRMTLPASVQSVASQECSPRFWCPEFLLGFHYVGIEVIGLMSHGSKAQSTNDVAGLSGMGSPHPRTAGVPGSTLSRLF